MDLLSVIFIDFSESISNRLNQEISNVEKEGMIIDKNIYQEGRITIIDYNIRESTLKNYTKNDFKNIFNHYIANALSDIILNVIEEKWIHKILMNDYYYFNLDERKSILKYLKDIQRKQAYRYSDERTYGTNNRKVTILQQIMDYLKENNELNIDGFIRFRLKYYINELEDNLDKAVEDFLMEKEYDEFIRLLRYFVDIQEAKVDRINVLIGDNGKYYLYDEMNRRVKDEYVESLAFEMDGKDISYDDLLISSLITLAPKKIIFHSVEKIKNSEIIEVIKNVFLNRVFICKGCDFCIQIKNVKE